MKQLLLGSGNSRRGFEPVGNKFIYRDNRPWYDLTTLDIDPSTDPDYIYDLNNIPLPFPDNSFDEIHAYDVLEHVGRQGDWRFFFAQFLDFWRILKPGGRLFAICPTPSGVWAWADPGHSRVIARESLVFLSQKSYTRQIGSTPMTDYRHIYSGDFEVEDVGGNDAIHWFILRCLK